MKRSTSGWLEHTGLRDDSSDDDLGENLDTNWLDDVDPEQESLAELERATMVSQRRPSYLIQMVLEKGHYSADQADLVLALNEVDGLGFMALPDELQLRLVESVVVRTYEPGEVIMTEDTLPDALPLFLVVASASTATTAEVDLIRKDKVGGLTPSPMRCLLAPTHPSPTPFAPDDPFSHAIRRAIPSPTRHCA